MGKAGQRSSHNQEGLDKKRRDLWAPAGPFPGVAPAAARITAAPGEHQHLHAPSAAGLGLSTGTGGSSRGRVGPLLLPSSPSAWEQPSPASGARRGSWPAESAPGPWFSSVPCLGQHLASDLELTQTARHRAARHRWGFQPGHL